MSKKEPFILPLVESVCNLFSNISLTNVLVIGCQHILPTTFRMFYSLIKRGLKPENIHLFGKCYSTDPLTYKTMQTLNIQVDPLSFSFDPYLPYDEIYANNVKTFIEKCKKNIDFSKFKKIILFDDGGYLITEFSKLNLKHNIVSIEQTTSGYEKIKTIHLNIPVINVARSKTKLKHENVLIAEIVCYKIMQKIQSINHNVQKILIIGNGYIGSAIYEFLQNEFLIDIYDKKNEKSTFPKKDFLKKLKAYDIIIGCTGEQILSYSDYKYLKNEVILISASSSDREFDASHFRKQIDLNQLVFQDIKVNNTILLNNGFPINFDKDFAQIDHEGFQLTRSLLIGAFFQAMEASFSNNRFYSLSPKLQTKILKEYYILKPLLKKSQFTKKLSHPFQQSFNPHALAQR